MSKFILELVLLVFVVSSCYYEKKRVNNVHLHNYPMFEDMDCPEEFSIDNEKVLKLKAKSANMKYVDYLHYTNKKKQNEKIKNE